MKVIIIGPAHPLRGGIANSGEALCMAFSKAGHEALMYSFSLQYPALLFPGKTQLDNGPSPPGLTVKSVINSVNPLNWILVANAIVKEAPDLVIVRYWLPFMAPCLGTISRIVKRKLRIPVIALADNIIPHEKRIGDRLLTKYFIGGCDAFVTMSKSVQEDLKQFIAQPKSLFIPHPIYDTFGDRVEKSAALKKLGLDPAYHYLLFFGFVRKYKGLDLMLKALASKSLESHPIKLIVAGEFYESEAPYLSLIKELGLADKVLLHAQYISSEEVKYYFCAADMVVQPYHTATQSGVTQIAYHFNRPMLVTDVGGLAEIVPHGKCGYVVEKNPEAIAACIADFYDHGREETMSANCSIEKERFSWNAMVEGILKLKEKI